MASIQVCVSLMFDDCDPYMCSGSQSELGESAGSITWRNCLAIAENADCWLNSDRSEAVAGIREHASEYGAWDDAEIASWSELDCLAFMVQEIASDLRMCGSDEASDLLACVRTYDRTDWEQESEYPRASFYRRRRMYAGRRKTLACAEYYTGI